MSAVFEGYERQYCELSANLSKICTAAGALNGGSWNLLDFTHFIFFGGILKILLVDVIFVIGIWFYR